MESCNCDAQEWFLGCRTRRKLFSGGQTEADRGAFGAVLGRVSSA